MKELTYGDQINIEVFKQIIKCLNNDIEDVKKSSATQSRKTIAIFKLSQARADLILNAKKNYPEINWLDFLRNSAIKIDREIVFDAIINSKNAN